jgi:cytochrome c-type biogenesis protein
MDGVFLGSSLLAAFVAGSVALFAPCCITVMFPAYLAAAVRNHRWRLVPLTMVFGAGVAVVLVPITLGLSLLTESLLRFHGWVYGAGALLMIVLAWLAATGASWSLPILRGAPDVTRSDSGGVFALGVFSGAASACCAPVLVGVLALSAITPGILAASWIGLAYVFGMVFPLLVVTLLWDRSRLADRGRMGGRAVAWSLGARTYHTTTTGVAAAALFTVMAIVLAVVAATGATLAPAFQRGLAARIQDLLSPVVRALEPIPDPVIALVLIGIAVAAVAYSGRRRNHTTGEDERAEGSEHDGQHAATTTDGHDCH